MLRIKPLAILKPNVWPADVPKMICQSSTFYVHICAGLQQHVNKPKKMTVLFLATQCSKIQYSKLSMPKFHVGALDGYSSKLRKYRLGRIQE